MKGFGDQRRLAEKLRVRGLGLKPVLGMATQTSGNFKA